MIKIVVHRKMKRAELAALVCKVLEEDLGDYPTLVGGSAASIYTDESYASDDLDIVTYKEKHLIRPVMQKLGFREKGSYWEHPETSLFVQFVSSPTMIGNKYIAKPSRLKTSVGDLPIISALDSACDRLSWYLSGDAESLEHCVNIVVTQKVPLSFIEMWLKGESWPEKDKRAAMIRLKRKVKIFKKARR